MFCTAPGAAFAAAARLSPDHLCLEHASRQRHAGPGAGACSRPPGFADDHGSGQQSPRIADRPGNGFVAKQAVTATKTDTPIMETPQSITVITRDRIELTGAQSAAQAAGYTAGVSAAGFGTDNRTDSIKIRGTDSTQYLDGLLNAVGFYNNTPRSVRAGAHRDPERAVRHAVRPGLGGRRGQSRVEASARPRPRVRSA